MEKQPLLYDGADVQEPTFKQKWLVFKDKFLKKQVVLLIVYVLLYVASGVINSLFLKKTMNSFANYPFFLNQVTNYGYIPIFGAVVLYQIFFTKNISKEMRMFAWWKFGIMGALDAVNGYFVVIGGIDTSGPMQQVLNQAIIPVTMLGSFLVLKERYSIWQLVGAALIVGGVVVSLIPSLTSKDNSGNVFFWNMFYLAQAIPFAASNVYKDIAFKAIDMDVWYLQFWDVFYQSIVGTLLFPINTVLPPPATIGWDSIPDSMKNGGLCLIGHNLVTPENSNCGIDPSVRCDDCQHAAIILLVYMCINVIYNVFILLVIKHGSATVLSIAQTVRLPLTSLCFSFAFIMGAAAVPLSGYTLYGLLVIIVGLVGYRAGSLMKKKPEDAGEEKSQRRLITSFGPGGTEIMTESIRANPLILPKTITKHREQYFTKLGIPEARAYTSINTSV